MKKKRGSILPGFFLAGLMALAGSLAVRADEPEYSTLPETVTTTTSDIYPQVTCTGGNPEAVSEVLQMAVDTRDTLTPLLKLGPTWRYPVHITVISPDSPLAAKVRGEQTSGLADGKTLRIEALLPADDPAPREFVQRQFVTALLWEKYFKPDTQFTASTRLDIVPIWLIEGLREWLNNDPDHNREAVVKRAALAHRAPTLAEVTGWQEISDDRLLGLWQRSFCYYLVESLLLKNDRRVDFEQWVDSITGPNPSSAERLFPTEMGWQRELLDAPDRSRDIVYTWDQSASELAAADSLVIPKGKDASDDRICTIETVSTYPRTKDVTDAISRKIFDLTALELRAHPSWRPIIALYRLGLTALTNDKTPANAKTYFHQANVQRAAEMADHQKLIDYANWYEVTNSPAVASHFQGYFKLADELDKAEPDPAHPNPLRANLLQVESRF